MTIFVNNELKKTISVNCYFATFFNFSTLLQEYVSSNQIWALRLQHCQLSLFSCVVDACCQHLFSCSKFFLILCLTFSTLFHCNLVQNAWLLNILRHLITDIHILDPNFIIIRCAVTDNSHMFCNICSFTKTEQNSPKCFNETRLTTS